jgi:hypothetical protein
MLELAGANDWKAMAKILGVGETRAQKFFDEAVRFTSNLTGRSLADITAEVQQKRVDNGVVAKATPETPQYVDGAEEPTQHERSTDALAAPQGVLPHKPSRWHTAGSKCQHPDVVKRSTLKHAANALIVAYEVKYRVLFEAPRPPRPRTPPGAPLWHSAELCTDTDCRMNQCQGREAPITISSGPSTPLSLPDSDDTIDSEHADLQEPVSQPPASPLASPSDPTRPPYSSVIPSDHSFTTCRDIECQHPRCLERLADWRNGRSEGWIPAAPMTLRRNPARSSRSYDSSEHQECLARDKERLPPLVEEEIQQLQANASDQNGPDDPVTTPPTPNQPIDSPPHTHDIPDDTARCEKCHQTYSKTNIAKHRRVCAGPGPFECPSCLREFLTAPALKRHQPACDGMRRTNHHARSSTHDLCEKCQRMFRNTNIAKHRKLCAGPGPFDCDTCPRKDFTAGSLKIHKRACNGTGSSNYNYQRKAERDPTVEEE